MAPRIAGAGLARLSPREHLVLVLMARGRSNVAIEEEFGLGAKTVESHVRGVYRKLGLLPERSTHRRVSATLIYLATQEHGR